MPLAEKGVRKKDRRSDSVHTNPGARLALRTIGDNFRIVDDARLGLETDSNSVHTAVSFNVLGDFLHPAEYRSQ
jgi:hypothetical protein